MGSPSSDGNNALDEDRNFCDAQARAKIKMAPSAASFASMRRLYCQGVSHDESVMESIPGRMTVAGPAARGRRKAGGEGRGGWGMIPFKPRDCGAGERERVNVRRLSVPPRPFALEPSELDAGAGGGGGLGARGGFRFDSPPLLRVSTFMEPRLPITVCASSSVSSSSVLTPDAELEQNVRQRRVPPTPLCLLFLRQSVAMWLHTTTNTR